MIQHHQMSCFLKFISQTNKIRVGFFAKINVDEEIVAEFYELKSQMVMLAGTALADKIKVSHGCEQPVSRCFGELNFIG